MDGVVIQKTRPLGMEEQSVLLGFSKALAPVLAQFCMQEVASMVPNQQKVQLNTPMLAGLTFQVAGYMTAEYLKRCSGEVPVKCLNEAIPAME